MRAEGDCLGGLLEVAREVGARHDARHAREEDGEHRGEAHVLVGVGAVLQSKAQLDVNN